MRAQILKDLARSSGGSRLRRSLAVAVTASATVVCLLAAAPAQAKNLYTLDANADSGGQIVVDAAGNGVVREERLYQLIRQAQQVGEHTVSIRFLDGGVHAYSFTFG